MKEECLAAGVSPNGEQDSQAQHHEFNAPAHSADGSAEGALEVHEDEHGAEQEYQMEARSGETQPEHQRAAFGWLADGGDDFVREKEGQDDGDDESSGQHELPAGEELTVGAAGIGQAEEEPKAGQERHGHHAENLPVGRAVESNCIGRQPKKKTFHAQRNHAGSERPLDNRTALVPRDGKSQSARAEKGGESKDAGEAHRLLQFMVTLTAASKSQASGWHKQNCSWKHTPPRFPLALGGTTVGGVTPDGMAM